ERDRRDPHQREHDAAAEGPEQGSVHRPLPPLAAPARRTKGAVSKRSTFSASPMRGLTKIDTSEPKKLSPPSSRRRLPSGRVSQRRTRATSSGDTGFTSTTTRTT